MPITLSGMITKSFIALLFCWIQWQPLAFGLDIAKLNKMTPVERSAWVGHFVEEDLSKKDSARAFTETDLLLDLSKNWDAPDIAAQVYGAQGDYLLNLLHNSAGARSKYAQGIDFANLHGLEVPAASMLLKIGSSYCQENQRVLAYEYYFRAHDVFARVGFAHIPRIDQYEYDIGRFLYDVEDYTTALTHFSWAEKYPNSGPQVRYKVLTALSQCYEQLDSSEQTLAFLKKRAQVAQQENNPIWMGESALNTGQYHLKQGCYSEARIYLATALSLSAQNDQLLVAAQALISLSTVNLHEGNIHTAAEKLTEAETYLRQTDAGSWYPDFYHNWELIYERSADYREAYRYDQIFNHISDSIRQATDLRTYSNIQVRLEGRRHLMQTAQLEQMEQTDRMLAMGIIFLFTILSIAAYFVWKYQQRRQRALVLGKQQAEQALERVLQQKIIEQQKEVEEIKPIKMLGMSSADDALPSTFSSFLPPDPDPAAEQHAKEALEKILKLTLLTEDDSRDFRLYFEKVHPGFFAQLRVKLPDLTQSETRLLALTKLNLKTREMSEILNVEPNSIRRLRNRIRQKYNLPAGDNFEIFLIND